MTPKKLNDNPKYNKTRKARNRCCMIQNLTLEAEKCRNRTEQTIYTNTSYNQKHRENKKNR